MPRPGIRRFNRPRLGSEAALGLPLNLRRLWLVLLIAAGCIALIVALAKHEKSAPQSSVRLTSRALAAVSGVPQSGVFLGSAKAPGQLVVYADLTSLGYADFQDKVLPTLVERYVKPGKLRLQFATVAGTGAGSPDSDARQAALLAQAAGLQNHLWQFAGAFSSQYVGVLDETTKSQILRSVPGLIRTRALSDVRTPRVQAAVARNTTAGQVADARGGLALMLEVNRGAMQQIPVVDDASEQLASIRDSVGSLPARPGAAPSASKQAPTSTGSAASRPARPCGQVDTTALTAPIACTTATARLTLVPQQTELALPGLRARLLSISTVTATSASGRARNRMRVVARLRVRNRGDRPLFGGAGANFVYLTFGRRHVNEDHHTWQLAGAFNQGKAIPPGATRTGVLHFELAGSDSTYLQQHGAAQIGVRPSETPGAQGKVPVGVIRFNTG
jgi:hypothetical protein